MDFINKGFSSFLIVALVFLAISFLINLLPVILIAAAGIWGISYTVRRIKLFTNKRKSVFKHGSDEVEVVNDMDLSQRNIIDVDYTEVK